MCKTLRPILANIEIPKVGKMFIISQYLFFALVVGTAWATLHHFNLPFHRSNDGNNNGPADNSMLALLESNKIVPDALNMVPRGVVQARYGNFSVNFGNSLTPEQVKDAPLVSWDDADPVKLHTLLMVDLDAPSRLVPILRASRHWLVVNIPGTDVTKGDICTAYKGAGPPMGTGYHRYVFAVFEQQGKLTVDPKLCQQMGLARTRFSTKKFAQEYKLGEATAANFYNSKHSIF